MSTIDAVPARDARAGIDRVKAALDVEGRGPFSFYLVRGGVIAATGRGLMAAAPFPWPGEVFVSGEEFERVLARVPDAELRMTIGDGKLTVSHKKFRGVVKVLDPGAGWGCVPPSADGRRPLTEEDLKRMAALEPFISDDPTPAWTNALIVQRGRACAVGPGGVCFAMAAFPDFGVDALIPKRALSLALKAPTQPSGMTLDEEKVVFWWKDGGWLRSQLVVGKVPGTVDALAERSLAGATAPPLSAEWKEAFERVAGFAEAGTRVRFYADRIVSTTGSNDGKGAVAEVEDAATTALPDGRPYVEWPVDLARLVVGAAEKWDTTSHPATFAGPLVKGLVAATKS